VDLKFIDRVIRTTLILAAVLFPFIALYINLNMALSILLGAVWGALNLWAIKIIIISLMPGQKKNTVVGLLVLFLKLPVLYALGYLLVTWNYLSVGGLLWGFSGILIVPLMKVLGRMYLGLDDGDRASTPQETGT
jgi:hypothetical protein